MEGVVSRLVVWVRIMGTDYGYGYWYEYETMGNGYGYGYGYETMGKGMGMDADPAWDKVMGTGMGTGPACQVTDVRLWVQLRLHSLYPGTVICLRKCMGTTG